MIICILLCFGLQNVQAQLLQLQDPVSSKNFNPEKYAGIRGTPFLQEKWVHGSVTTNLGVYNDLELKIDLYDNILFFNNECLIFSMNFLVHFIHIIFLTESSYLFINDA